MRLKSVNKREVAPAYSGLFVSAVTLIFSFCICPPSSISIRAQHIPASQIVRLGEMLYFDKRLSADGTVSCATCHDPAAAFASKDTVAIGMGSKIGTRNVPTILNAKFGKTFFWDGRVRTLEEQAKASLSKPS